MYIFFSLSTLCMSKYLGSRSGPKWRTPSAVFWKACSSCMEALNFGSRYWFCGTLPRIARNPERVGCRQKPVIAVKSRHQGHQGIAAITSNRCVLFIPQQLSMVPIHHPSNINATLSGFQFSRCSLWTGFSMLQFLSMIHWESVLRVLTYSEVAWVARHECQSVQAALLPFLALLLRTFSAPRSRKNLPSHFYI